MESDRPTTSKPGPVRLQDHEREKDRRNGTRDLTNVGGRTRNPFEVISRSVMILKSWVLGNKNSLIVIMLEKGRKNWANPPPSVSTVVVLEAGCSYILDSRSRCLFSCTSPGPGIIIGCGGVGGGVIP